MNVVFSSEQYLELKLDHQRKPNNKKTMGVFKRNGQMCALKKCAQPFKNIFEFIFCHLQVNTRRLLFGKWGAAPVEGGKIF